jgi:hypothetical protein
MINILCFLIIFSNGCHTQLLKSNNDATSSPDTLINSLETSKLTPIHYIAIAGSASIGILIGIVLTTIVFCILLKRFNFL